MKQSEAFWDKERIMGVHIYGVSNVFKLNIHFYVVFC